MLWLLKRRESTFVGFHGKEVLNFQITLLLGFAVCWVLTLVIIGLVLTIIGLVRASRGEYWRYPLSLRLVS